MKLRKKWGKSGRNFLWNVLVAERERARIEEHEICALRIEVIAHAHSAPLVITFVYDSSLLRMVDNVLFRCHRVTLCRCTFVLNRFLIYNLPGAMRDDITIEICMLLISMIDLEQKPVQHFMLYEKCRLHYFICHAAVSILFSCGHKQYTILIRVDCIQWNLCLLKVSNSSPYMHQDEGKSCPTSAQYSRFFFF